MTHTHTACTFLTPTSHALHDTHITYTHTHSHTHTHTHTHTHMHTHTALPRRDDTTIRQTPTPHLLPLNFLTLTHQISPQLLIWSPTHNLQLILHNHLTNATRRQVLQLKHRPYSFNAFRESIWPGRPHTTTLYYKAAPMTPQCWQEQPSCSSNLLHTTTSMACIHAQIMRQGQERACLTLTWWRKMPSHWQIEVKSRDGELTEMYPQHLELLRE